MMHSLTPILSTIIAILIFVFVTQPKYYEAVDIRNEASEYVVAAEQYATFNAEVQRLLLKRNSAKVSDRERLDLLVPPVLDDTRVMVDIERLAENSNLFIASISASNDEVSIQDLTNSGGNSSGDSEQGQELRTTDITVDVIGSYTDFKNFIHDIETSLTIMEVTSILYTRSDDSFQTFTITVRTYALPSK